MTYSFVIPIYNEAKTLPELQRRLAPILTGLNAATEVILVDDGSKDQSVELIRKICQNDPRFKLLQFARNFGHQIAITAGMDAAKGEAIIIMDADLQDPPEVVFKLIEKWKEGYEVVYAVRKSREGETWFKKTTAKIYYRLLKKLSQIDIPVDTGDFRLVDRKALDAFLSMREGHRFVRGMFTWIGFKQIGVEFERAERFAGETNYPFKKMLKFAIDGILSFSYVPPRMVLYLGAWIALIGLISAVYAVIGYFQGKTVPGWTSLFVLVAFLGGIQLIVLGMLGEYIGRVHEEVKKRPLYIVRERIGFSE